LAGVPPEVAVGTAVLPALIYSFTGSLPLMAVQTGSTLALCLGELTGRASSLGLTAVEVAGLSALLVGATHLLLGILDLAFVTELFSQPLLRGRTAAAAVLVLGSMFRQLLGIVPKASFDMPLLQIGASLVAIPTANHITCTISAVLIALLLALRRLGAWVARAAVASNASGIGGTGAGASQPTLYGRAHTDSRDSMEVTAATGPQHGWWGRIALIMARLLVAAANALVVVVGSLLYRAFGDHTITLIPAFGMPNFQPRLPMADLQWFSDLAPASALMAFLSLGGHLIVAERIQRTGDQLNPRREIVSLGLSSFGAALAGGMPVMPNLAVCQALRQCTSGLAAIGNTIGHLFAFLLAARVPELQRIPTCAISAILFVEFMPLLLEMPTDIRHLVMQMKRNGGSRPWTWRSFLASDLAIYLAAVLSPLLLGIIKGSVAAIVLELLFAVTRFAGAGFTYIGRVPGTDTYDELGVPGSTAQELPGLNIVRFSGPRWFGNCASTTRIARRERQASGKTVACIVADMSMVSFLDETALVHYKREWGKPLPHRILISNCCARVRLQVQESGLVDMLQQPPETLARLHDAVLVAEAIARDTADSPVAASVGSATCSRRTGSASVAL